MRFIGYLVEKCVACQSRKSDFGCMAPFSFFTLLMMRRLSLLGSKQKKKKKKKKMYKEPLSLAFFFFYGAGFDRILGNDKGVGVPVFPVK